MLLELFPQFSTPRVHYVVKSNLLHFVCNFTTDATAVSDIFKITWHDSSHKTLKIEGTGSDFKQKMVINWSKLEKNGGMKLGDTVSLKITHDSLCETHKFFVTGMNLGKKDYCIDTLKSNPIILFAYTHCYLEILFYYFFFNLLNYLLI